VIIQKIIGKKRVRRNTANDLFSALRAIQNRIEYIVLPNHRAHIGLLLVKEYVTYVKFHTGSEI
jgi:hypothetical protein